MTIETPKTPPDRPNEPSMRGTYGQGDFVQSAQRSRLHKDKDQTFAPRQADASEASHPYGEGGFAAGGDAGEGPRQSGYGSDFGQLEASQRHEKQACERDYKKAGTGAESSR